MKTKYLFFIAWCMAFGGTSIAQKRNLDLNEIWGNRKLFVTPIKGFSSMSDGVRYSEMIFNVSTRFYDVLIFDYKTGKQLDTLIKGHLLIPEGRDSAIKFSGYELNPSATMALFTTEEEAIYRHSSKANHYIFNLSTGKLIPVSEKGKQMYATISPDGKNVAFVRDKICS